MKSEEQSDTALQLTPDEVYQNLNFILLMQLTSFVSFRNELESFSRW